MATAADRIAALEKVVRVLEIREQVQASEVAQLREADRQRRDDLAKQRDECVKLREDVTRFREQVATDLGKQAASTAVHQAEIAELKKSREHWSQRVWQVAAGLLLAAAAGVIGYLLMK